MIIASWQVKLHTQIWDQPCQAKPYSVANMTSQLAVHDDISSARHVRVAKLNVMFNARALVQIVQNMDLLYWGKHNGLSLVRRRFFCQHLHGVSCHGSIPACVFY